MKAIKRIINFSLLTSLSSIPSACGGQSRSEANPASGTTLRGVRVLNPNPAVAPGSVRIENAKTCALAVELYNQTAGHADLPNPFALLEESQQNWAFSHDQVDLFYKVSPERLKIYEFTLGINQEGGGATQEKIVCPLPMNWLLEIARDAEIIYPSPLKFHTQHEPFQPQVLASASIGGMGFQRLFGIGYEPFLTWYLKPVSDLRDRVRTHVSANFPALEWSKTRVQEYNLIPDSIPDPLQILAFTSSAESYEFSQLWVKGPRFPIGTSLVPHYSFQPNHANFELRNPLDSMVANSHPGLLALQSISYPDFIPTACEAEASIDDPTSCTNINRAHLFSYFEALLTPSAGKTSDETCLLLYFSTTLSATKGLAKLVCIDKAGTLRLAHNGLHDYVDEAIEAISK